MPLVFPFSPWFKWLLLLFYGPVDQPPRWDWSCSVPRNGGTHTGILRGIVEMLQDAKPLCEFECVRNPAPWHCASLNSPCVRMCSCVCLCWSWYQWLLSTGQTQLAARLWQAGEREGAGEGKEGSEGGRWGSWWGIKGFLHSWALFATEHNLEIAPL